MKHVYNVALLIILLLCIGVLEWIYRAPLPTKFLIITFVILFFTSPFLVYVGRSVLLAMYYKLFVKPDPSYLLKEHVTSGIVLPSDLDINMHMNNTRYKRESDFARFAFMFRSGMYHWYVKTGLPYPLLVASTGRYRKSFSVFQTFKIVTKIVYWDEEKLYFEQRFVAKFKEHKEFVYQINWLAFKIMKGTPDELIEGVLSTVPEKPSLTKEIENFIEYNKASSASLKQE